MRTRCAICKKKTDLYFADGEDYEGSGWGPNEGSGWGPNEGPGSSVAFPQAYICSVPCLHTYIDRCVDQGREGHDDHNPKSGMGIVIIVGLIEVLVLLVAVWLVSAPP